MKTYEVLSSYIVFSAKGKDGKKKDFALKKGDTVELSETELAVQALLSRKQIREIEKIKELNS